ncbi:MAG: hypothetical protein KC933_03625 [Myxococcales bacterium]|nr:hypothetical protein [Myxococcales bacterium]
MKTLMVSVTAAGLAALWGCSQAPAKCGEVECKAICEKAAPPATAKPATPSAPAAPATAGLSTFEHSVLDPLLDDVRQGIRPWSDESVGICKGEGKECEEWVGTDVGELPEGRYMLRAELRVPKYGEQGTWKVRLDTNCETTKVTKTGESKNSQNNSKEYDVRYIGEERGYRLSPLFTIESPSKGGTRTCTWKLTMLHPDGDKSIEGKWTTPDADSVAPPEPAAE